MENSEKKTNSYFDEVIKGFESMISQVKKALENIDEEYRKKCEEAKAGLNASLAKAEEQYEFWKNARDNGPEISTTTRTRKPRKKSVVEQESTEVKEEKKEEKEETIVDTIFDDNNVEEEEEDTSDSTLSEDSGEWESDATLDEKQEEEEPTEDTEEVEVILENETEMSEINLDDWPDAPEEWN